MPYRSSRKPAEPVGANSGTPRIVIRVGMVLHNSLGNGPAQPAGGRRLLGGHDALGLLCCGDHGLDVEWLHRRHGDHPSLDALLGKLFGRHDGAPEHSAVADDGDVVAVADRMRLAGHES